MLYFDEHMEKSLSDGVVTSVFENISKIQLKNRNHPTIHLLNVTFGIVCICLGSKCFYLLIMNIWKYRQWQMFSN